MKKKMFNSLRNKKRSINEPTEINTSVPIPHYAPNQGLSPKEYMISQKFADFETNFETECKKFLSKSNVDEYNGTYKDAIIQTYEKEAKIFIQVQREDHKNIIMNSLNEMHIGDRIKCESKLLQFQSEIEKVRGELEKLRAIYWRGTSYNEKFDIER